MKQPVKYGALPDSVLEALILSVADVTLDPRERMTAAAKLRPLAVPDLASAVGGDVLDACDAVVRGRGVPPGHIGSNT